MANHRSAPGTSSPGSRTPGTYTSLSDPIAPPPGHDAEFTDGGTLADLVRNSQAYKTAYGIFSQLADKSWLNRLIAIPTSVQDASSTWFDDNGLSNKFNDKQSANYQYCIQQIQNLMAEYYAWKNSLPITQVDQAQDAGFNSAITGNGVDSSAMDPSKLQSDPSALQSTDPMSMLQQFVGLMTSASGGITSIVESGVSMYKSLRDVSRADDRQLFDFYNYLNENGFNIVTSKDGKSIDFDNLVTQYSQAPRKKAGYYRQLRDEYKSGTEMSYWSQIDEFMVDDIMRDLVTVSYESAKSQYEMNNKKAIYERDYYSKINPSNMAEYDEVSAKFNSEMSKLRFEQDNKFNTMFWDIVDKWKEKADNGSWIHKDLLSKLLTGYSPYSSTVENISDGVGVASDIVSTFMKYPGVKKPNVSTNKKTK